MNIEEVGTRGLCTMCGTCAGVCPTSAISMDLNPEGLYVPQLQIHRCIECGRCIRVCPGIGIKVKEISAKLFTEEEKNLRVKELLGTHIGIYIGHARDPVIRENSTSGGAVTALLLHLLEKDLIDGVLVTKAKDAITPVSFIAVTKKDIQLSSTSLYCPTTPNVALKHVLENEGRYAVVGLPCHIHGIRKAEELNKALKNKIVLHLGIVCSGVPNFFATYHLIQNMGLSINQVKNIKYRVGWPTKMVIELKNRKKIIRKGGDNILNKTLGLRFFLPRRCTLCFDQMNELADISFGDAWFDANDKARIHQTKKGKYRSLIITRSKMADTLLKQANNRIPVETFNVSNAIRTQKGSLNFKKKVKARMTLLKVLKRPLPIYDSDFLAPTLRDYIASLVYFCNAYIGSKKGLWRFMPGIVSLVHSITRQTPHVYG